MSTGSLTTQRPQLQRRAGEGEEPGSFSPSVTFMLMQPRRGSYFLFPAHRDGAGEPTDAEIHTCRWTASTATANTELLPARFLFGCFVTDSVLVSCLFGFFPSRCKNKKK